MRKRLEKRRIYPPVFIPLYDRYGRQELPYQAPFAARESVKQSMDEYYGDSLEKAAPDNLMFMKAEKAGPP